MDIDQYKFEYTHEYREGYKYKQPVERVNGKEYYEYTEDSFERKNWAKLYWEHLRNRSVLKICKFDSNLWVGADKESVYNTVLEYENNPDRSGYSTTEFFDYEIWIMNKGWELYRMGMLGVISGRIYKKGNVIIEIGYGVENTFIDEGGNKTKVFFKFYVQRPDYDIVHMPSKINEFIEPDKLKTL